MSKIQKIDNAILRLPHVSSLGVIGDPGCEGLGNYNMRVYAGVLEKSAKADITLIVGDLVPEGTRNHYQDICSFTESLASNPVYVLRGNHDTGNYTEYFGRHNYALLLQGFAVVVLDNAMRTFEEEGLDLLKQVLSMEEVTNVIISFHIPVPNHFILNNVSEEEFGRLREAYAAHKDKVRYLLCGHVHSRFEDIVDGIPLICTGGGGAMIEDVSEEIKACDIEHHMVYFRVTDGVLEYQFSDLTENSYQKETLDDILRGKLEETVQGELLAHLKYLMFADRARRRGMDGIASLFDALAASEYYHARSFYSVLEQPAPFKEMPETFVPCEEFEYQRFYRMMEQYAADHDSPLSARAYAGAAAAEKVHARLLKQLSETDLQETDLQMEESIYVCPICGYLMTESEKKDRCPICGGPSRQYKKFEGV